MRTILESIATFLEADGWPIHPLPGDTAYSVTYRGRSGQWPCVAIADEEARQFVFYSACPVPIAPERYAAVAEFLLQANYDLRLGSFEMDFASGDVRCRTGMAFPAQELGPAMVAQLVYGSVLAMDRYLPGIRAIAQDGATPAAARRLVDAAPEEA